jgi:uncharacterized protein (TIGR00266 family)
MLEYDETAMVERSAMAAMSTGLAVKVSTLGSLAKAAARSVFGGEQIVFGAYRAEVEGAWLSVAPKYPGDIEHIVLQDETLIAESGSLLALSQTVGVGLQYAGLKGIMLHEGASYLKLEGSGDVLLCSYGGVERIDLGPDDTLFVDSGHLVAFTDTLDVGMATAGGIATSAITGEGLVFRFTGPGTVYMQTRAEAQFRSWLLPSHEQNTRSFFRR